MLRKTNTNKTGFTIIEVVITIAIGAAVMALVLNAVSGARRSQRNNARTSDVGLVAAAVNQYYGNRNTLPENVSNINESLENELGYYPDDASGTESLASTFGSGTFGPSLPNTNGDFLTFTTVTGTNNVYIAHCATSSADPTPTGDAQPACTTPKVWRPGVSTPTNFDEDKIAVIRRAACTPNFDGIGQGGIREMVIVYQLEGQDGITCREV